MKMKTGGIGWLMILLCILTASTTVYCQDCAVGSKGNEIIDNGKCAPVEITWTVKYRDLLVDENIQVKFNWGDGSPAELVDAIKNPLDSDEWVGTHTHVYCVPCMVNNLVVKVHYGGLWLPTIS